MKIKDEHYKQIVRGLESIEARLRFSMGEYQAAGHSTQRFMWDGLRSAKINGNSRTQFKLEGCQMVSLRLDIGPMIFYWLQGCPSCLSKYE